MDGSFTIITLTSSTTTTEEVVVSSLSVGTATVWGDGSETGFKSALVCLGCFQCMLPQCSVVVGVVGAVERSV
jgi:hypothetical protein